MQPPKAQAAQRLSHEARGARLLQDKSRPIPVNKRHIGVPRICCDLCFKTAGNWMTYLVYTIALARLHRLAVDQDVV